MKYFDKKSLIITFLLFSIICISIYYFTKDEEYQPIYQNSFYVSSEPDNTSEESQTIIVHVDGEVLNPGVVTIPQNSRILDAINSAGGMTNIADTSKINLAYSLKDGQKIHVPSIYSSEEVISVQNDAGNNVIVQNQTSSPLININSATQAELESLPNIGPSTASKIIEYRNANGNFKKIEDILKVNGIGESKFNNIKNYICI